MYIPNDSKDLVRKLVYLYERTKDQLADERDKWDRYNKLYNSYVDEDQYPFPFKVFIPWAFSIIETKVPRFVNGLLYRNPIVSVSASHPLTPDRNIRAASRLLNGKWMTDQKTYRTLTMMLKEGMIYGTSFGFIQHVKKRRSVKERIPTEIPGVFQEVKRSLLHVNRPELVHTDLWCTYPDLDATEVEDMQFFFTECIKDMDDLRYGQIKYENLEELDALGHYTDTDEFIKNRMEGVGRRYKPDAISKDNDLFKPRHLLQGVLKTTKRNGDEEWRIVAIGNKEVLLRNDPMDFFNIVKFTNIPQPHDLLGLSEIFSLESLQYAINDFSNMEMTNALMALTKMWLVGDAADADLDQFVLEPFNVIQVADVSQVKELTYSGLDSSGERMIGMLVGALQQASGIQDYLQGATPQRQEYATTVLALQNASEARIDCQIKWAERETISQVGRKFIECAQFNLTDYEYVANEGNELEKYDLNDIQGLMDFTINGASAGVNDLKRGAYMDFAKIIGELLGDAMPMEVRVELSRKVAQTFDGLEGLDEILSTLQGQLSGGPQVPGGNGTLMPPGMAGLQGGPSQTQIMPAEGVV